MMDDLAKGQGYWVAGMDEGTAPAFEYIAAFCWKGPGWYKDNAQPKVAKTIFLRPVPGKEMRTAGVREKYHTNWLRDLEGLKEIDAVIVSGYAWRTQREVIAECRRRGIPVAMWSDSNLRSQRGRGLKQQMRRCIKKRLLRRIIEDVDLLLTANRLGVAYWRYYGAAEGKIVRCPCYTDYAAIDAAREKVRAEVLGRIGLQTSDRFIFSAARLVEAKGLDVMMKAFVKGGFAQRGWKYVLAGAGSLEGQLKQLADGLLGKSIFFIGFQQPADNLALMAQAEILALPSRYEPHGIVVGEALAAGTPVLASDVVGAAFDLVQDGNNGLIFRTGDEENLRQKLSMLDNETVLAKMQAAARPTFEEWYRRTSPMEVVQAAVRRMLGTNEMD